MLDHLTPRPTRDMKLHVQCPAQIENARIPGILTTARIPCQCSTWGQCSTWCRCSEYIHLRRKPQLEAQGVCKVRVFSNFQSIPSGVRHPNTLWNSCCTTRILAICPCLFYNDDMVIVWRHGHYTEIWPFYNDMAIVRGHGHCMWTWPLYGRHGH